MPSWLSAEDSRWLAGGYQNARGAEHATLEGFVSGRLQQSLETAVGNYIPMKADALLGQASMQRGFIVASNVAFSWPCYPTYFGSKRVYIPEVNALARMAMRDREEVLGSLRSFVEELSVFANEHEQIAIKVVIPDASECSAANPAVALSSDAVTTAECVAVFDDALGGCSNVAVISLPYSRTTDYYEKYYTGDHHWNGFGAQEAFDAAGGGEPSAMEVPGIASICMNGSLAREGLLLVNEPACEPVFDVSSLRVADGSSAYLLRPLGGEALAQQRDSAEFNFYHSWYGEPLSLSMSGEGGGSALLVCDSFGAAFQWLVASDSERTLVVQDLHVNKKGEEALEERVRESGCDTVYFVGHIAGFTSLSSRFPFYFSES